MPSLRELQCDFMRAILDDPASPAASAAAAAVPVVPNGIAAAQRLEVYAGNARANFLGALELSYPVIRRLVGPGYFEQCARGLSLEHGSRSGDLQPAGAPFAGYLAALHGGGEYGYLGDVARFEWLLQEALLSADHARLDLGKLAALATADYDGLRFRLHPSLRLFQSPYPCLAIWRANSATEEPPVIDLDGAPYERIAIVHNERQLHFHVLSPGELAFLEALQAGAPFADAIEAGAAGESGAAAGAAPATSDFNAGDALRRFVLAAVIVDFH